METESQCSSDMPPLTDRFEDEETSSLSDYDSEWTQVSGTEDDGDFPPLTAASDRPLSRADTIDGSVDGDVWEGFIDGIHRFPSQSSDETRPLDVDATDAVPEGNLSLSASVASRSSEDEIVNDALDSSFVGTLRASRVRSATSSLHASLTESQSKLRLSFPDPLSSREDLDSESAVQDVSTPSSDAEGNCVNVTTEDASSSFADIEAPAMLVSETVDKTRKPASAVSASAPCALSLFLYGSAASSNWHTAETIMILALQRDNDTFSFVEGVSSRRYYFDNASLDDAIYTINEKAFSVRVIDRTSSSSEVEFANIDFGDDKPSLALIFLPSRLPAVLQRHRFYLPLINPPSLDFGSMDPVVSSEFSEQGTIDSALYTLKMLDLPKGDVIVLDPQHPNAIMNVSALGEIHRASLAQALSVVFGRTSEKDELCKGYERVQLFANKWYTFALVAATLLAITMGGIRVHRSSALTPPSTNATSKAVSVCATSSFELASTFATSLIPSNHRSVASYSMQRSLTTVTAETITRNALASVDCKADAFKRTDVVRGVIPAKTESSVGGASSSRPSTCRSKARSWANKLNLSIGEYIPRDLVVWPIHVIGVRSKLSQTPLAGDSSEPSGSPVDNGVKSLSLRAIHNSLAIVSSTSNALKKAGGRDMSVVYEAIDELLHALGRQMNSAQAEIEDARTVAQWSFSFRNARAKENARRLRRAGEQLIKAAGQRLRSRGEEVINIASQVRESAKAIRQDAINSRQSRRLCRRERREKRDDRSELNDGDTKGEEYGQGQKKRGRNLRQHQRRVCRSRD